MKKYILAIDQGTTSTKAFLIDRQGNLTKSDSMPITQYYPVPGYVEHDASEILYSVLKAIASVMKKTPDSRGNIEAMGITNQRETTICFEKGTGRPVSRAIVWQCRRTSDICRREELVSRTSDIIARTGLKLDPYFSATKIRWILENIPGAAKEARAGEILFGNVDTYLIYMLTGFRSHVTDYSNASRTLVFDINKLQFDDELLELFGIPKVMMPEVLPSSSDFGEINIPDSVLESAGLSESAGELLTSLNGVHIEGDLGDQAAALFGQNCFSEGEAKTTYGTGCFTLMNIGDRPVLSKNGLLTSCSWSIGGKTMYALEGSVFQGGSIISWLKDELLMISKPEDCDPICFSIDSTDGVYLVPAFTGLGAPYWDSEARGIITGLTRGTGRAQIVRAAIESIAYQVTELAELMMNDSGITFTDMKVDGGVCGSEFLMQFQADLLGVRITRALSDDMTAIGVSMMAGLTCGMWKDMDELRSLYKVSRTYEPQQGASRAESQLSEYKKAVRMISEV